MVLSIFDFLQPFDLGPWDWVMLMLCGMLVAMAKTGIAGVYNVVVPLMAIVFGGRASTGVLLPILLMGDVLAVSYYNRSAEWNHVLRLVPPALGGVLLGTWVGGSVSEETFRVMLALVVLLGIGLMVLLEVRKVKTVPDHWWFGLLMGLLAGFTTMVGNVAGPIVAVYMLSMRLPKNAFIGTTAWFFLLVNVIKLPLHVFVWETISWSSLGLDLFVLPAVALGAVLGIRLVRIISEQFYRRFVILATVASALLLLF